MISLNMVSFHSTSIPDFDQKIRCGRPREARLERRMGTNMEVLSTTGSLLKIGQPRDGYLWYIYIYKYIHTHIYIYMAYQWNILIHSSEINGM